MTTPPNKLHLLVLQKSREEEYFSWPGTEQRLQWFLVYKLSKFKITGLSQVSECACVPEALTEKEPRVLHRPVPAAPG